MGHGKESLKEWGQKLNKSFNSYLVLPQQIV